MKRLTILLALATFCLPGLLPAAETGAQARRPEQTAFCTADSENDWIELGEIIMQPSNKQATLYVRVVDHISFYRVKIDGSFYAVTKNEEYKPSSAGWNTSYTHRANGYYLNVPN